MHIFLTKIVADLTSTIAVPCSHVVPDPHWRDRQVFGEGMAVIVDAMRKLLQDTARQTLDAGAELESDHPGFNVGFS